MRMLTMKCKEKLNKSYFYTDKVAYSLAAGKKRILSADFVESQLAVWLLLLSVTDRNPTITKISKSLIFFFLPLKGLFTDFT